MCVCCFHFVLVFDCKANTQFISHPAFLQPHSTLVLTRGPLRQSQASIGAQQPIRGEHAALPSAHPLIDYPITPGWTPNFLTRLVNYTQIYNQAIFSPHPRPLPPSGEPDLIAHYASF